MELTKQGKHNAALELLEWSDCRIAAISGETADLHAISPCGSHRRATCGNLSAASYHYEPSLRANLKMHLPYTV
ncbi:MAG TPA: hypothetical protein VFR42_00615 [Candidatus Acidoferrum sp.]|nr:hypothetical protein [Candidatus Acidoferrum sp.]